MRLRQGQFSYLPDFTDEELASQVQYAIDHDWAPAIEYTTDPNPRNLYWEMWGTPMFDVEDPSEVIEVLNECREARPEHYIALNAYSSTRQRQGIMMNIIVQRPTEEPGFRLDRTKLTDRRIAYTVQSDAVKSPGGDRYGEEAQQE